MQDSVLCCRRLLPCLGLIRLCAFILPGTPVGPLWFNSHYQCPTHVGLPLTVLVAHWPQQGSKHTNPLWSQNGSWTIAWHLQHSHEVAKSMSYSAWGNNNEDNAFILFGMQDGLIWWDSQHFNRNHTTLHRKIKHVTLIKTHTSQITPYAIPNGFPLWGFYILMQG